MHNWSDIVSDELGMEAIKLAIKSFTKSLTRDVKSVTIDTMTFLCDDESAAICFAL